MADPIIGPPNDAPPAPSAPTPAAVPAGSVTLYEKGTLKPVVVDAADAPGHILSGNYGYAPGTRIPIESAGKIGTVDADDLRDAVTNYNAKPVTGAQWHEHEQQKKYGSPLQAAEAFGVNALDSATLGASNAIIGGIGGKAAREHLRGVTEANPTAATAGDVAGFVAPVVADVFSGGTLTPEIAAAEGARLAEKGIARTAAEAAVLGPTRLLSKAGGVAEGVARAVVGKDAESAAARVAQNIIAGGVRGAVEGGVANLGAEVGHQYLQDDPDLSGEALASAFTHGALIGGALGGALHGVSGLLTKRAAPAIEEAALGADEGALRSKTPAEKTVADAAAKGIIDQVSDPKAREVLTRGWKERGAGGFAKHDEGLITDAKRSVAKSLDTVLESGRDVDLESFGDAKASHMAELVPAENLPLARKAALTVAGETQKVLDGLNELASKGGQEGSVKRIERWLEDFRKAPDKEWNDPASLFMKIDDFKRIVGREAKFGVDALGKRGWASERFEELYGKLQQNLQDEGTWGAGAVAQRDVNKATTDLLAISKTFEDKFVTKYDQEAGRPLRRADPGKVSTFINGLTKSEQDLNTEMIGDYISRKKAFFDAVEKNYDLTPAGKRSLVTARNALDDMGKTITKTGADVSQMNALKALLADEGHGHNFGHSVPVIGGIIGMAVDSVTKPGASLARLAELEHTKNRILGKIDDGVASIKQALRGSGERKKPGLPPHGRDTYEKRRASVLHVASQSDAVQAHLTGTTAPIAQRAPAAAAAFQQSAIRTISYLMSELPKPPPANPSSLTPKLDMEAWQPSDQQKSQFNRKFDMATHPEHALKLVADGTITPQHVEALQATHPQMYALQSAKLKAVLAAETKPVPFTKQAAIKSFLGIPQMDPDTQRLMQAAPAAHAPGTDHQQGVKRPLKIADNLTLNANRE